ncbi:MAG: glycerol-3-phosphate 1-O-acyltransferase PlsY [Flavobacteriales bacterium]|nr:glycerol-3-phosphate 1-O-acyltransferase PlsY [Flavobacteriales bacterium]
MYLSLALFSLLAYLLGSFPSAVLVGKALYGIDVRQHGSMNAGATNTFRVLGKSAGTLVLILDILKGFTAANLVYFFERVPHGETIITFKIAFGLLAVLGHLYPVFAEFKGGKGIATLLGLVITINWKIALICAAIFLLVLVTSKMVSLGSIVATASFVFLCYAFYQTSEKYLLIFGIFAIGLVVYTHRANITRIIKGEEKKIYLFKKKTT